MAKRNSKDNDVDTRELEDTIGEMSDGVADALEHLRAGRIDRGIRALEKIEPEEDNGGDE